MQRYKWIVSMSAMNMIGQTGVIFNKPRNSSIGCKTDCNFALISKEWITELISKLYFTCNLIYD